MYQYGGMFETYFISYSHSHEIFHDLFHVTSQNRIQANAKARASKQ